MTQTQVVPEVTLVTAKEPCPICFNSDLSGFVALDCEHTLCKDCFDEWHVKNKKNRCSLCRREIESIDIESGADGDDSGRTESRCKRWYRDTCNAECGLLVIIGIASLFIAFVLSTRVYLTLKHRT